MQPIQTKKTKFLVFSFLIPIATVVAGYLALQYIGGTTSDLGGAIFAAMIFLFALLFAFVEVELSLSLWVVRFQKETRSKFNLRLNQAKLIAGGVWLVACWILGLLALNSMEEIYFHILEIISLIYAGICILINILTTIGWIRHKQKNSQGELNK